MNQAWITHLGYAMPGPSVAQQDFATWMEPRLRPGTSVERWRRFNARCGVAFRHSVLDVFGAEGEAFWPLGGAGAPGTERRSQLFAERALPLALAAVQQAVPGELPAITHVITTTCTGAVAPGLDLQLIHALRLPGSVQRLAIGFMGCYAAVQALRVARDACRADPGARVLVVCCELSSLHLQAGPADDALLGACLFGDGASAAIIQAEPLPGGVNLRIVADRCAIIPDSAAHMSWFAGDQGFVLGLSPAITGALGHDIAPVVAALLAGRDPAALRWVVHPGGPRILEAVERVLALDATRLASSRAALRLAGNRSSGTVLAILREELATDWSGAIALMAFGPGLTVESMLLERA